MKRIVNFSTGIAFVIIGVILALIVPQTIFAMALKNCAELLIGGIAGICFYKFFVQDFIEESEEIADLVEDTISEPVKVTSKPVKKAKKETAPVVKRYRKRKDSI